MAEGKEVTVCHVLSHKVPIDVRHLLQLCFFLEAQTDLLTFLHESLVLNLLLLPNQPFLLFNFFLVLDLFNVPGKFLNLHLAQGNFLFSQFVAVAEGFNEVILRAFAIRALISHRNILMITFASVLQKILVIERFQLSLKDHLSLHGLSMPTDVSLLRRFSDERRQLMCRLAHL